MTEKGPRPGAVSNSINGLSSTYQSLPAPQGKRTKQQEEEEEELFSGRRIDKGGEDDGWTGK